MNQFKKKTVLVVLTILLAWTLVACTQDTTIEDYRELEAAFHALVHETELTVTSETRFELLGVEDAILYITTTLINVDGLDETTEVHHSRDQYGESVTKIEMIIVDGNVYISIEYLVPSVLNAVLGGDEGEEILDLLGISIEDITIENMLGDAYTHMLLPDYVLQEIHDYFQERLDSWTGIFEAFSEEELESYLSRSNNVFRIEVEGELIDDFLDGLLEELNLENLDLIIYPLMMVADIEDRLWIELETDFVAWLRSADLADAWFVVERTRISANTYQQNIELYIPNRIFVTDEATVVVGESTPAIAPARVLAEAELEPRIEAWIMDLFIEMLFDDLGETSLNGLRNPALFLSHGKQLMTVS